MVMADAAAEECDKKPVELPLVLFVVPVMTIAPLTVVKVMAAAALVDVALLPLRQAPKSTPEPCSVAVATLAIPVKVMLPDVPALTLKP